MHEASIAKGILDTAVAALPAGGRILRVRVVAGVMAGVEASSLELYWQELSQGTPAQGSALALRHCPARLVCIECGRAVDYHNDGDIAVQCSACGGNNRLEGGNELYIESMEIEEP